MTHYLVGLSGGVDSSVAAALLLEQGHQVTGASLRLADEPGGPQSRSCCSAEDLASAADLCKQLGIPYYVFDQRAAFDERVVQPFVTDYLHGRTPNPCLLCNLHFKFGELWQRARGLGARLATGHYARLLEHDGRRYLAAARDRLKDQSYFLARLAGQVLDDIDFPLGERTKDEVRALARRMGLPARARRESQEVCFASAGAAALVEARAGRLLRPGPTVDQDTGTVLGQHPGIHRFTIGQRRGLGTGGGPRRFVTGLDAATSTVLVGPETALGRRFATLVQVVIQDEKSLFGRGITAKIRARHEAAPAAVQRPEPGCLQVEFAEPQRAPAPGQACVLYCGERVVGAGTIATTA